MTLRAKLKKKRLAKHLSTETVAYCLRDLLPESLWVSSDTLRRWENKADNMCDPVFVAALASVYGMKVVDLSSDLANDAERVRDLLSASSRCTAAA